MGTPKESGWYCLGCHHALGSLESSRCPECGRAFDLSEPRSFGRLSQKKNSFKLGLGLILVGMLMLLGGWIPLIMALKFNWFPDSNLIGGLGPLAGCLTLPAIVIIGNGIAVIILKTPRQY